MNKKQIGRYFAIGFFYALGAFALIALMGYIWNNGYKTGKEDVTYVTNVPVVGTVDNQALVNSGYLNYGNDSLETGNSFTVTTPQDNSQSELAQQIMDFLGQASKVDISIKGDKNIGGSIDVHLEFDK